MQKVKDTSIVHSVIVAKHRRTKQKVALSCLEGSNAIRLRNQRSFVGITAVEITYEFESHTNGKHSVHRERTDVSGSRRIPINVDLVTRDFVGSMRYQTARTTIGRWSLEQTYPGHATIIL